MNFNLQEADEKNEDETMAEDEKAVEEETDAQEENGEETKVHLWNSDYKRRSKYFYLCSQKPGGISFNKTQEAWVLRRPSYRTRANNGRSQLVTAPLSSKAKMHFLLAFYVTIWGPKT